ncbi:molecular chaperone Hsp90 [Gordonia sinesedis]
MPHPPTPDPDDGGALTAHAARDADLADPTDPFGTAALRVATLAAWRSSPTRLAEDRTAESDLVTVGYRDRLFTELVANAADAAAAAGIAGEVAIWADDTGGEVHIANTGAPLTADGVRSLVAMRISAKVAGPSGADQPVGTSATDTALADPAGTDTADTDTADTGRSGAALVGHFGVGFTATATVARRVEIRSATGSVAFDREAAAAAMGADEPASVPLLRLAWPVDRRPRAGFDTEVVLFLDADLAAGGDGTARLLADVRGQATDLLTELPSLHRMTVGDEIVEVQRRPVDLPGLAADATVTDLVVTTTREPRDDEPAVAASTVWREVSRGGTRWQVRLDDGGRVVASGGDLLRAPTPTDIELSLPARCITRLPLTPDRRHLHPAAEIDGAAAGYTDLMLAVDPADRLALVPAPHRARGATDARLIDAVLTELRDAAWLPGVDDALVPSRAVVLVGLTDALAELLGDLFVDLVHPDLSLAHHLPTLRLVGVEPLSLSGLADRLAGIDRPAHWWRRLYDALAPLVGTGSDAEEIAALPIPRADGRLGIGVRGLFSGGAIRTPMRWIPTVDPDADHPLLERLGLRGIDAAAALADPALRALVEQAADGDADLDDPLLSGLAEEVLELLRADPAAAVPGWLSQVLLPDETGELRPADELLLPDGPLAALLVDDHPFGVVDAALADRVGVQPLRRLGVGWGFTVVADELPVAPEHDLPDEEQWWESLAEPPENLVAVRDLDLVDDDRWADALSVLAADPSIAPLLADRAGYTAWWLRTFATIDGRALGDYRAPSDETLAGVLDPLDHPSADDIAGALAALPPSHADEVSTLLGRLGDPGRAVAPGIAAGVHAAIVGAVRRGVVAPGDVPPPERVRTLAGTVARDAVIVDRPWWLQAFGDDEVVLAGLRATPEDAAELADLLDLPLASEEWSATVREVGEAVPAASPVPTRFGALWAVGAGGDIGQGDVRLHEELWITLRRNESRTYSGSDSGREPGVESDAGDGRVRAVRVDWWVDERGVTHLAR